LSKVHNQVVKMREQQKKAVIENAVEAKSYLKETEAMFRTACIWTLF